VLIFRDSKDFNQSELWKESFKLLSIQNELTIIELSNELIKFRIISLKSYYQLPQYSGWLSTLKLFVCMTNLIWAN
jgi:hypothetical protein